MARRVFFSFHYDNDINRSMTVRNSWVTQGKEAAGFIDKAEFEQIKRQGDTAVHNWIDKQLEGNFCNSSPNWRRNFESSFCAI